MRKRMLSLLLAISLLASMLVSCSLFEKPAESKAYDDNYRHFYEIYVRSFSDTNGDGIGDLRGVINKLDYLHAAPGEDDAMSLGIDAVWLMPVFTSPSEHKYDVTDYLSIDPSYGTMEDFEELLTKFHERGIRVIVDMVLNHTSSQHPWFQEAVKALNSGTESKYVSYYNFTQEPPLTEPKTGGDEAAEAEPQVEDGWYPVPGNEEGYYYEARFWSEMPDLNLASPDVQDELKAIMKFWIDKGVDGYRLDACKYFFSDSMEDSIAFLKTVVDYCKSVKPDFYLVGEVWDGSYMISQYYRSGIDSLFNFDCSFVGPYAGLYYNVAKSTRGARLSNRVEEWNTDMRNKNPGAIDAPFLSNHDTTRWATILKGSANRKMAASLCLLLPGNCFIYYGEEIGMTNFKDWNNDSEKRLPIKWSVSESGLDITPPAGSTHGGTPPYGVYEQLAQEDSLLNHYKQLIKLKNRNPEIQRAQVVSACDIGNYNVAAYTCGYDGSSVMVLQNLTYTAKTVDLRAAGYERYSEFGGFAVADDYVEEEANKAYVKGYEYEVPEVRAKAQPVVMVEGRLIIPPHGSVVLRCPDKVSTDFVPTTTTAAPPVVTPSDTVTPSDAQPAADTAATSG